MEVLDTNIINIVYALKKSNQSDDVILMSMKNMGFDEKQISEALKQVNKTGKPVVESIENDNILSLVDLYDASKKVVSVLESFRGNNSICYSAQSAINLIKSIFTDTLVNSINYIKENKCSETSLNIKPTLKYSVAQSMYESLKQVDDIESVHELRTIIKESFTNDKNGYLAASIIYRLNGNIANPVNQKFEARLNEWLTRDHTEQSLKNILTENQWSPIAVSALKTFKVETPVHNLGECKAFNVVSPVITINEGVVFNISGKNYFYNGTEVSECSTEITNTKYNNVLNGLSFMEFDANKRTFLFEGVNKKVLSYDVVHDIISIDSLKLDSSSILSISESLKTSGLFNGRNAKQYDAIMRMFESRDLIQNVDICKVVVPAKYTGRYCNIFENKNGSFKVNFVDSSLHKQELKDYSYATSVVKDIEEFMDCDASKMFESRLIKENDEKAIRDAKIAELSKSLDKLYEQRNKFTEALKTINDKSLNEALDVINSEVKKLEKQLQLAYL